MTIVTNYSQDSLDAIVNFAIQNTRLYRERLSFFSGASSYSLSQIPVLTHAELAQDPLGFASHDWAQVNGTSGTTKIPKLVFRNQHDLVNSITNQKRLMTIAGVVPGDRVAVLHPFGLCGCGGLTSAAAIELGAQAIPIGAVANDFAIGLMSVIRPSILDISPSRMESLLSEAETSDQIFGKLRVVMLSGECPSENLLGRIRDCLGAKVFNQYGTEETDGLGSSTRDPRRIRLLEDSFIFEFQETSRRQVFDVLVTSLYQQGTPIIRYRLGDWVRVFSADDGTLEIEVVGRSEEFLELIDGEYLAAYQIDSFLEALLGRVPPWQIKSVRNGWSNSLHLSILESDLHGQHDEILRGFQRCSVDFHRLVTAGFVELSVHFGIPPIVSPRGKKPKFIQQ